MRSISQRCFASLSTEANGIRQTMCPALRLEYYRTFLEGIDISFDVSPTTRFSLRIVVRSPGDPAIFGEQASVLGLTLEFKDSSNSSTSCSPRLFGDDSVRSLDMIRRCGPAARQVEERAARATARPLSALL